MAQHRGKWDAPKSETRCVRSQPGRSTAIEKEAIGRRNSAATVNVCRTDYAEILRKGIRRALFKVLF
jgi:hypothetical protein